jgi:hypothetical protein
MNCGRVWGWYEPLGGGHHRGLGHDLRPGLLAYFTGRPDLELHGVISGAGEQVLGGGGGGGDFSGLPRVLSPAPESG